jgi:DNA (cytosine-5)-methyltransferase 1
LDQLHDLSERTAWDRAASGELYLPMLSLFSGAGGLDVGLQTAGFACALSVEMDEDARDTLAVNHPDLRLAEPGDIHGLNPHDLLEQAEVATGEVALLAGGPPCQPFSKSANWANQGSAGMRDPRASTLDAYLDVVAALRPQVLLLENVRGLVSESNGAGAMGVLREGIDAINESCASNYLLQVLHVNAADYGVPQQRERVLLIASIDGKPLVLPEPTHGDGGERWATTWDAIGDLDSKVSSLELEPSGKWADLLPSIPEGLNYLWHTPRGGGEPLFGWRTRYWSFLLKLAKAKPSWTIQAAPGPATGPFHWHNRLLSVQELARLQTFPDGYQFMGNRRSIQRQIGNAVPCAIGELLGREIRRQLLDDATADGALTLIPSHREDCPPPEAAEDVPSKYLKMRRDHPSHPGTGLGPGRVWTNSGRNS